jgi:hypothetical protein
LASHRREAEQLRDYEVVARAIKSLERSGWALFTASYGGEVRSLNAKRSQVND